MPGGGRSREQQLEAAAAAVSYLGGHFYLQNGAGAAAAGGGCGPAGDDVDDDDDDEGTGSIIPDHRTGKHSFCRLCLTHSEKLNPLFPVNASPDRVLLAQILDCVEVQITLPDDIKALICTECVQQIYAFASFKELCKSNDQLLKSQTFAHESDDPAADDDDRPVVQIHPEITPEVTMTIPQQQQQQLPEKMPVSGLPDATLLEKLFEQGVQVEAIGDHPSAMASCSSVQLSDADEREAERKAKNAARMRRWRLRQRQKQEQRQGTVQEQEQEMEPEKVVLPVVVPVVPDPVQLEQEEALRMQQAKEMFALLAQQQLRQVEAEIRRLKAGVLIQEQIQDFVVKQEPRVEAAEENGGGESSRQTSPSSEQHMAAVRRSRAEYMRKWRAKRSQSQQQAAGGSAANNATPAPAVSSFGFVGRPPILSPAPGETEKIVIQRHNRAEYMRRWRRERLKQELSPSEFDDWCTKSEQRRRFREWQVMRESASSAGDETMDCGELESSFRTAQS